MNQDRLGGALTFGGNNGIEWELFEIYDVVVSKTTKDEDKDMAGSNDTVSH